MHGSNQLAGTYSVRLTVNSMPKYDLDRWAALSKCRVSLEIQGRFGLPSIPLIEGDTDTIALDFVSRTVHLEGRDRAASLIDTRSDYEFQNRTTTEIVSEIAQRHGLAAQLSQQAELSGRQFQDVASLSSIHRFSRLISDWDIVVELARQTGNTAYVHGNTLYFGSTRQSSARRPTLGLNDVTSARRTVRSALADGITVTVSSWNAATGDIVSASTSRGADLARATRQLAISRPNLTREQAAELALRTADDISTTGEALHLEMNGESSLMPGSTFNFHIQRSSVDRTYLVRSIVRRFSSRGGFTQSVLATPV